MRGVKGRNPPAENQTQREKQIRYIPSVLRRVNASNNEISESSSKHQETPDEEEHQPATGCSFTSGYCVAIQADWIIPADIKEDSHERVPRHLNDDIRKDEYLPRIRLGRSFTGFVEISLRDEVGHDLLTDVSEYGQYHEDRVELVLHSLQRVR